jgi:hypothetical protein
MNLARKRFLRLNCGCSACTLALCRYVVASKERTVRGSGGQTEERRQRDRDCCTCDVGESCATSTRDNDLAISFCVIQESTFGDLDGR